ncbi:hypothetical protein CERZMDRAFT_89701 [Cercospora zeae-maydis SCOH1-5]|uniref:Uncharacterized protein n=1 Tax=Cercospora zeae-maydis SCOH1-5 TaxID=717836 RepID=A0A6A6FU06_9PEZI|nr:hypothetical protein CERZMDRAFT_89701 [Cercospora zeae-maydis SCOH1-5]
MSPVLYNYLSLHSSELLTRDSLRCMICSTFADQSSKSRLQRLTPDLPTRNQLRYLNHWNLQ